MEFHLQVQISKLYFVQKPASDKGGGCVRISFCINRESRTKFCLFHFLLHSLFPSPLSSFVSNLYHYVALDLKYYFIQID